jgi:hypothetical protein
MMTVLLRGLFALGVLAAGIAVGRFTVLSRDLTVHPTVAAAEAGAGRPAPRCWEATVYLPLADNQGRPFSEGVWQEALEVLVASFGGATLGQPQEGCWLDAGRRVCRERVRPVVISFAPQRLDEFRQAVHDVGKRLGQEAMYVRFEEPRVELVSGASALPGGER